MTAEFGVHGMGQMLKYGFPEPFSCKLVIENVAHVWMTVQKLETGSLGNVVMKSEKRRKASGEKGKIGSSQGKRNNFNA